MKKIFVLSLVAAILSAAMLAGCSKPIDDPVYTSAPDGERIIDENTAKRAAAERAEIAQEDISFEKVMLDSDDGRYEYDIEFVHDGYEYELEVDATDGRIISYEKELADRKARSASNNVDSLPENNVSSEIKNDYISKEEARSIALAHAGVNPADIYDYEWELDRDGAVLKYEIDFKQGGFEYSYDINAADGTILHWEKEIDD